MNKYKYYLIVVVWGEAYTDLLINLCIPSLLSKGNLSSLTNNDNKFLIYTTRQDEAVIRQSSVFSRLSDFINVDIQTIDADSLDVNRYESMSVYHGKAVSATLENNATAIFLAPDFVFSTNYLSKITRIHESGKKIIFTPALRLNKQSFLPEIFNYKEDSDKNISIDSPKLCELALDNLHDNVKQHYWKGGGEKGLHPAALIWRVDDNAILGHFFHLHPILIEPPQIEIQFTQTIDSDLPLACYTNFEKYHVINSTEDAAVFEVSDTEHYKHGIYTKGSYWSAAAWASVNADKCHRFIFNQPIFIHFGKLDPNKSREALDEAKYTVLKINKLLGERLKHWLLVLYNQFNSRFNALIWYGVIPGVGYAKLQYKKYLEQK